MAFLPVFVLFLLFFKVFFSCFGGLGVLKAKDNTIDPAC